MNELTAGADDRALDAIAPATPDWAVRDLLAHLAGVAADIVAGELGGVGSDEWTAQHVTSRRGRPVGDLLAEWNEHGPVVESVADGFGPAAGRLLGDATTHEHDIRGALGVPGARGSDAVALTFTAIGATLGTEIDRDGAGAVEVRADGSVTTFGTGAPAAVLRTTRFEFVRAVTGRRSLVQIAAYDWQGDVDPARLVLRRFVARPTALVE